MDLVLLRKEIAADEGYRHRPYQDTFGNWTCGVGHKMNREPRPGERWSDDQINETFVSDVAEVVSLIEKKNWWGRLDTDARQRALVNMAFNLGVAGVSKFATFLWYVYRQDWDKAVADLRNTKWYAEVPARAERICKMLTSGSQPKASVPTGSLRPTRPA